MRTASIALAQISWGKTTLAMRPTALLSFTHKKRLLSSDHRMMKGVP